MPTLLPARSGINLKNDKQLRQKNGQPERSNERIDYKLSLMNREVILRLGAVSYAGPK